MASSISGVVYAAWIIIFAIALLGIYIRRKRQMLIDRGIDTTGMSCCSVLFHPRPPLNHNIVTVVPPPTANYMPTATAAPQYQQGLYQMPGQPYTQAVPGQTYTQSTAQSYPGYVATPQIAYTQLQSAYPPQYAAQAQAQHGSAPQQQHVQQHQPSSFPPSVAMTQLQQKDMPSSSTSPAMMVPPIVAGAYSYRQPETVHAHPVQAVQSPPVQAVQAYPV